MVDGKMAMRMSLSVASCLSEGSSLFFSLQVQSLLTLERSLDLKKAVLLALLNLQSQEARYRSQQKHSTHRPPNQWGAAGLPGQGWLIKERENKQQGKGRVWQSGTPQKHREKWRDTDGGGDKIKRIETKERWDKCLQWAHHTTINRLVCWVTPRPQLTGAGKVWLHWHPWRCSAPAHVTLSGEVCEQLKTRGGATKDLRSALQITALAHACLMCTSGVRMDCHVSQGRDVSNGTWLVDPCCEHDCHVCVVGSQMSPGRPVKLSWHLAGLPVQKKNAKEWERQQEGEREIFFFKKKECAK